MGSFERPRVYLSDMTKAEAAATQTGEPTAPARTGAARILLVDDEPGILDAYGDLLKKEGYAVTTAGDGQSAIELLFNQDFELVLSDIRMPRKTGMDLLKWTAENRPFVKVILFTGYSQLHDAETAARMGCSALLAKPVARADLLRSVADCLAEGSVAASDEDRYARIPIDDFISGKKVAYSIYVRLGKNRFLKIAHVGDDLGLDRVFKLKERGVTELWLEREDFQSYAKLSERVVQVAATKPDLGEVKRARLIKHACEVAYENLRLMGVSDDTFQSGKKVLEVSLHGLGTDSMVLALIDSLEHMSDARYAHAASTGLICALAARVMGWSSQRNIVNLTLGGFLHDIGLDDRTAPLAAMDPEALYPKVGATTLPKELIAEYEKHPLVAAERLAKVPGIAAEVITIVQQHHEHAYGTGFPKRLKKTEIFPMARIVTVVDLFVEAIVRTDPKLREEAPDILQTMMENDPANFEISAGLAIHLLLKCNNMDTARAEFHRRIGSV
jgi:response regulator RpfG family c-di-GMP phosphodiesterase